MIQYAIVNYPLHLIYFYMIFYVSISDFCHVPLSSDNLTIIGSDNGLLSGQCQAIIWTNAGILLMGPSGTNFSEI